MSPSLNFARNAQHIEVPTRKRSLRHSASKLAPDSAAAVACFGQTEIASASEPILSDALSEATCVVPDALPASEIDGKGESFSSMALIGRSLKEDIAEADAKSVLVAGRLRDRNAQLLDILAPAYVLLLHLLAKEEAFDELLDHPHYAPQREARERLPSRRKPAVLAVQFVIRPSTASEAKDCSDFANFLHWAEVHEVAPSDFTNSLTEVSLREAKVFVRDRRRRSREAKAAEPDRVAEALDSPAAVGGRLDEPSTSMAVSPPKPTLRIALAAEPDAGVYADFEIPPNALKRIHELFLRPTREQSAADCLTSLLACFRDAEAPDKATEQVA